MRAWPGHERSQSLEEGQRLDDRAGAVAPRTPEPVDHAPVRIDREPLAGDGGARDVPAETFESGEVVAFDRERSQSSLRESGAGELLLLASSSLLRERS